MAKTADRVLQIVQERGIIRARELGAAGISPTHLQRLYESGLIERTSRGIYTARNIEESKAPGATEAVERLSLAQVTRRVPDAVICLVSALDFHGLTTQIPHSIWIARSPRTPRTPAMDYPPIRLVRMSGASLTAGIETHTILNTPVRIYCPAKTVADCFKFRNKIGMDVALEALRDAWRKRRVTMEELAYYGDICRVSRVMRPYLESLI